MKPLRLIRQMERIVTNSYKPEPKNNFLQKNNFELLKEESDKINGFVKNHSTILTASNQTEIEIVTK